MYENTDITLDITLSTGKKHTLVFSKDNNGHITITLDDNPIDMIYCLRYISVLNNFSELLYNHMKKLMNS